MLRRCAASSPDCGMAACLLVQCGAQPGMLALCGSRSGSGLEQPARA